MMTINDIENILVTLENRHPDLNDAMLITLLKAGGWEEKNIHDAVLIFRNTNGGRKKKAEHQELTPILENPILPNIEEKEFLPEVMDSSHTLLEHNPEKEIILEKEDELKSVAEQILVQDAGYIQKGELPGNLPLRPFESSPHVWPLSLYDEVFHDNKNKEEMKECVEIKEEIKHNHFDFSNVLKNKDSRLAIFTGLILTMILVMLSVFK